MRFIRCGNMTFNPQAVTLIRVVRGTSQHDGKDVYLVQLTLNTSRVVELEHETPEEAEATREFIEAVIGVDIMPVAEAEKEA